MQAVQLVLVVLGILLYAAGLIDLLVTAFRQNWLWGLGVLVCPPLAVVFALMHWKKAAWPCVAIFAESALFVAGVGSGP
jgi:hypothetical protein